MSKINEEIEKMAETLEKSTQEPLDVLKSTIETLGADGIKKKLETLSDDQKTVLKSVMAEMAEIKKGKAAVSFDKEARGAKHIQGKFTDTLLQEEKADDDEDEKLVKPEAAKHKHQGDETPEGKEGQVIKGKVKEEAKEKIMQMEEKEHSTKDPKKLVEDEKKENKMKKSEIETLEENIDGVVAKAMDLCKNDEDKVKAKLEKKGLNGQKVQGAVDKYKKENMKKSEEVVVQEVKVEETKVETVTKSFPWDDANRLLKANTLGRNFHFDAGSYLANEEAKKQVKTEEFKKSEDGKETINDVIAKSMDKSQDQVNVETQLTKNKAEVSGKLYKSFSDEDLFKSLGLTKEEAEKIK